MQISCLTCRLLHIKTCLQYDGLPLVQIRTSNLHVHVYSKIRLKNNYRDGQIYELLTLCKIVTYFSASDSEWRGPGFDPHKGPHVVSLNKRH